MTLYKKHCQNHTQEKKVGLFLLADNFRAFKAKPPIYKKGSVSFILLPCASVAHEKC